jgi:hypothetical protein
MPPFPNSRPWKRLRSRSLGAFDLRVVRAAFCLCSRSVRKKRRERVALDCKVNEAYFGTREVDRHRIRRTMIYGCPYRARLGQLSSLAAFSIMAHSLHPFCCLDVSQSMGSQDIAVYPTIAVGIYDKRKLKTLARARPPIVNSSRYSATRQPTSWVRWPRSRAMTVRQNVHTA